MKTILNAVAISSLFLLGACANLNSIYHTSSFSKDRSGVISVDARQRMIIYNRDKDGQLRMCAEQFPDVFTIFGASLAGGGGFSLGADQRQAQASLAGAIQEGGSTIARTQTVNLLRESMYRTCERYMSGAIGDSEFAVQASRDVRAMVSVLAIEQLTGTLTPPAVALTFTGNANAASGAGQIASAMEAAKTRYDTSTEKLEKADTAFEPHRASLTDDGNCPELSGEAAGAGDTPAEDKPAVDCTTAKTDFEAARTEFETEKEHYELLVSVSGSVAQARLTGQVTPLDSTPSGSNRTYLDEPRSIKAVTEAVVEIVKISQATDLGSTCEAVILNAVVLNDRGRHRSLSPDIRDFVELCMRIAIGTSDAIFDESNGQEAYTHWVDIVMRPGTGINYSRLAEELSQELSNQLPADIYVDDYLVEADIAPSADLIIEYYNESDLTQVNKIYRALVSEVSLSSGGTICTRLKEPQQEPEGAIGDINLLVPTGVNLSRSTSVKTTATPPNCT